MVVGQDRPSERAAAVTVGQIPSITRAAACPRRRAVSRARAGMAGSDSVNDPRGHRGSSQYQRRLAHSSRRSDDP